MDTTKVNDLIKQPGDLSPSEIAVRDRYLHEISRDGHKWNAASRMGYTGDDNYYFVLYMDHDPYVQNKIRERAEQKNAPKMGCSSDSFEDQMRKLLHIINDPHTPRKEKIVAITAHTKLIMDWENHQTKKAEELERKMKEAEGGSGVMLVPAEVPLDQWEQFARWQYGETMKKMEKMLAADAQASH